jgi:HD-GYP domain-containing protein (c-di-GMP phosphodiesterase class II)
MRVKTYLLQEGCILTSDVYSLTNSPIIPKNTVLNAEHLSVLQAFLIKDVEVENKLVNGESFLPEENVIENKEMESENLTFVDRYFQAVEAYKKLFKNWQSGSPISISEIRRALVSFLEAAVLKPRAIFTLHRYVKKEEYLFHHAVSVAALSALLAHKLHYPKGDWIQIGMAGALSDCGMAKIDPKILNKQGKLSPDEFEEIKRHPQYSFQMLKQVPVIKDDVRKGVLQHHERMDGSGYPLGKKGDQLQSYGKIIAVADVYHAMTSVRKYKNKQSPFRVLETILEDDFGKFDVRVVAALTKSLTNFSAGMKVKLSDKRVGEVVFIEQTSPTRPMIKLETGDIIQLAANRQVYIDEVLE